MNIYVYEIRSDSKAFKIFIAKQFTFEIERYIQKELLVYLLNGSIDTRHIDFIKSIPALPFDMSDTSSYIEAILNIQKAIDFEGELEEIEYEHPLTKERMEQVNAIDTNIYFSEDYNFEDDNDEFDLDEDAVI